MKEQQQVPIHTEYIQIDQLLKLEGCLLYTSPSPRDRG